MLYHLTLYRPIVRLDKRGCQLNSVIINPIYQSQGYARVYACKIAVIK